MATFRSPRWRAGLAAVALALLAAGCLPPGTIIESYGGPAGHQLPCRNIASMRLWTDVGGGAVVVCAQAVPDTVPTQYATSVFSFERDGSPDLTFGGDGSVELSGPGTNTNTLGVARTADGAVWITRLAGSSDNRLYRITPDGTVDTGFGPGGARPLGSSLRSAAILPTGATTVRVVTQEGVGGCSGFCPEEEGLRVWSFGPAGPTATPMTVPLNHLAEGVPPDATSSRVLFDVQALGLDGDLRTIVGGTIATTYSASTGAIVITNRDVGAIRLDETGIDESYGTDGVAKIDVGVQLDGTPTTGLGENLGASSVAIGHGEVAFAVSASGRPAGLLGRLDPDGALDPSFDGDGLRAVPAALGTYSGLAIDGNRRVVAGVSDGISASLLRFGADGSVDAGFGTDGRTSLPQVASQVLHPTVSVPLVQIHVLVGHTQQGANGVDLLRIAP